MLYQLGRNTGRGESHKPEWAQLHGLQVTCTGLKLEDVKYCRITDAEKGALRQDREWADIESAGNIITVSISCSLQL